MKRNGFTLVEILIGMLLVALVAGAIYQVLVNSQRVYTLQTERANLNANNRAVVSILPSELRELNASDAISSDIVAMSATSVTYKAMRNLFVLCQPPDISGTNGTLHLWRNIAYGLRPQIDANRDSVFVFAEGTLSTRTDNYWVHTNVSSVDLTATTCPAGAASIVVNVNGVTPNHGLTDVRSGSPVRSFEMVRIVAYADAFGDQWLGAETYTKASGWSNTQPLLGPLAASGLQLTYFDAMGNSTATPGNVARIGVMVIGETSTPVRTAGGLQPAVDTLVTDIALRNNRQ